MKINLSYFFITAFIMVMCVVTTEARIHSQSMDDDNDRGGSVTTRDRRRRMYGYQEQQQQSSSSSPSLKDDEDHDVGHASLSFSDHRLLRQQQQRQNRNRKLDINDDDMILAKAGIIITEIMYNPIECLDSQGEWIEFYNNSPVDININGWTVQDNSSLSTTIDSGVVLRSGRYYVLGRTTGGCNGSLNANQTFDFYLNNNSGDTITVKDSVGNIIDQIQYNPRNEAAQPGYTMMRHPSVDGNYYPTNTWMQGPYGGNPHGGGYNFVATPPTQGGGDGGIIITEIMYNPIGCNDEYGEWIELYNSGNVDVNIANWIINDAAASNNNSHNNNKKQLLSSSSSLSSSASEGQQQHTIIIMKPGDYYILGRTQRNCGFVDSDEQFEFALNNDNDIITLQDGYGNIIDSHSYDGSDASPGHSIQRQPDPLTQYPTNNWIEGPLYGTPRSGYYNPFEPSAGPTAPPSQIQQPSSSPTPTPPYYGYNFTRIRHYQSYQLKLYCGSNAGYAIRFSYRLGPDLENYNRPNRYYYDDNLEYNCQQMSRRSYSHRNCFDGDDDGGNRKTDPYCFDRGHLVMANHLDSSETSIRESNYMTNILPQASGFNQDGGAWYYTEQFIECSRQLPTVVEQHIFGGAIFYDTSNDYFMESHGIPTPEEFWKVVIRHNADGTYEVMSWIFPNTYSTTDDKIQEYITTIDQIRSTIVDDMPELPSTYSEHTSMSTWENSLVGITCDYS